MKAYWTAPCGVRFESVPAFVAHVEGCAHCWKTLLGPDPGDVDWPPDENA